MITTLKSRINRKLVAVILPFSMAFGLAGYSLCHIQWSPRLGQQAAEQDDAAVPITQHVVLNFDGLTDTQSTTEILQ
ncbi:MAG: hypothetical protein ABSB42_16330 [Tepidisphaeraceae bacterium]|jgi:hypothetical protein